jgi:hypothetical protein
MATLESRNIFASKAPSICGVTLEQRRLNHAWVNQPFGLFGIIGGRGVRNVGVTNS